MVNARSNYKEEAVEFLKWLTSKEQQTYENPEAPEELY